MKRPYESPKTSPTVSSVNKWLELDQTQKASPTTKQLNFGVDRILNFIGQQNQQMVNSNGKQVINNIFFGL